MAYARIDGELADFDRDHPWKKEYVSHMEDGIDDCESQCAELKDSLTELDTVETLTIAQPEIEGVTVGAEWTVRVCKCGHVVTIISNTSFAAFPSESTTLFTLPEGYRPVRGISTPFVSQNGTNYLFEIATNGNVSILISSGSSVAWLFRLSFTYIATQ